MTDQQIPTPAGDDQPARPREPWTFTRREGEPFTIENAVGQAIGGASSCWEHLDRAGVFDSTRAKEIADTLIAEIRDQRGEQLPAAAGAVVTDAMIDAFNRADVAHWQAHYPVDTQSAATAVARSATRAGLEAALRLLAPQPTGDDLIAPQTLTGGPTALRRRPGRAPERPTLCCIVRYVGKYGIHATRAAIVSCTVDELDPAGDAPPLDSDMHVHLFVTTPSDRGSFTEYNVPYDPDGAPGTWSWPPRPAPTVADHIGALHITGATPQVRLVPVIDPRGGGMRA